jgi:hypothetical protein
VICTKDIDRNQLAVQLDDIRSRTKSSIELSIRLIDQSFLRFKATHRNLYAARRSQELMNALPKQTDWAAASRAQSDHPGKERARALHSAMTTANIRCDHCEGILLNNKAYRVRTEDHGLVLLDMIVCYACNLQAKNLGLRADEVEDLNAEVELALRNTSTHEACSI